MNMKPTLRLYIGPLAWYSGIVLAFLGGFLIHDVEQVERSWGWWIQWVAFWMWVLILLGLDHSPREYKYVWYDKGGFVCAWFRIRRDSNQDD